MKKQAFTIAAAFYILHSLPVFLSAQGTIDVSSKSAVTIALIHKVVPTGGAHLMDLKILGTDVFFRDVLSGAVYELNGRPDSRFRFRIDDFNTLKYTVKGTAKAAESEKFTLPEIFATAFGDAAKPLGVIIAAAEDRQTKIANGLESLEIKRKNANATAEAAANVFKSIGSLQKQTEILTEDWSQSTNKSLEQAQSSLNIMLSTIRSKSKSGEFEADSVQIKNRVGGVLDLIRNTAPSGKLLQTNVEMGRRLKEAEREVGSLKRQFDDMVKSYETSLRALREKDAAFQKLAELLKEFECHKDIIQAFMKKLDALKAMASEVESYPDFRARIDSLMDFEWARPEALKDKLKEQELSVEALRRIASQVDDLVLNNKSDLILRYVAAALKPIRDKGVAFSEKFDSVEKTLGAYATEGRSQFIFISDKPIEFQSGRLDFCLEIFNKSDAKQENSIYQLNLEILSDSKSFLDTSTGVFFCGLGDESYSLEDQGDATCIVKKGSVDTARAHIGALIHYGGKVSPNLAVAFSLGLALSDTRFQFFLGPSLAIGAERKVYVSIGCSLGSVRRLKGYDIGDVFGGEAKDIPTDYYNKLGVFLGISFKI